MCATWMKSIPMSSGVVAVMCSLNALHSTVVVFATSGGLRNTRARERESRRAGESESDPKDTVPGQVS